ncbi:hypothetical protein ANCCEY_09558 [Ancylostoma ceylanicum]|uniref:non-specific serine/threonine protein kinase n=1 Tax=Ancylostoma ceylanicum TaxID=53326 RepID=A0A0D6LH06_9BILA|nr:hypothetical protein ANCCEY_09558 [Ancylostoma ceylanicum]
MTWLSYVYRGQQGLLIGSLSTEKCPHDSPKQAIMDLQSGLKLPVEEAYAEGYIDSQQVRFLPESAHIEKGPAAEEGFYLDHYSIVEFLGAKMESRLEHRALNGWSKYFEKEDAALMDMFIRDKSDLHTGDLIITDDNLDEEDRHFNRYEVQLKYNEGRYTALYLISRQVCANNELEEKNVLYAMKTSIRPNSANIVLRMKFLHSHRYIHRDVKLTNICIGSGQAVARIFLIDYGDTVKSGKKIRYGTPDAFTLPFWSLDAHKRGLARERGDAESWFYVLVELLAPGCLPWNKMNAEADVQAAKQTLWSEGPNLTSSPHVHLLQELIRISGNSFDHETAKMIARDGLDTNRSGPLALEWAPPAVKINFQPLQQTSLKKLGARIAALKKGQGKTSEKAAKPAPADAVKKPAEVPTKGAQPAPEVPAQLTSKRKVRPLKTLEKSVEQTKASKEMVTEARTGDGLKGSARGRKQGDPSPKRAIAVRKMRSKEGQQNKPPVAPRRLTTARRPANGGKIRKK